VVTNGKKLRLLRNSKRFTRPTYVEFDLEAMVAGNLYSEFVILFRLTQRTRLPKCTADAHESWLERYYLQGIAEGGRVRERLSEGVFHALRTLGSGFLAHPDSGKLREAFLAGGIDEAEYYRQLPRLVYRLLFLMVAEERRLLLVPDHENAARQRIYTDWYGIARLRQLAERRFTGDRHSDLFEGVKQTFLLFRDEHHAAMLGLTALDGELFGPLACAELEQAACRNEDLLGALFHLSTFEDAPEGRGRARKRGVRRRVNYSGLDVEELGSVYEGLLEYHPQVDRERWTFDLVAGSERKQMGSYYTPHALVMELIDSALVPVMEERLAKATTPEAKERALLDLKVVDPAAGSGHFLLAAARRIGKELARVRTSEPEPAPEAQRAAIRDVVRHCLYAVDRNPLAVDLCKVALWIEGHNTGRPLSFLDHHVKLGDSLIGVFDLKVLEQGIPDDAYKPLTGDDKTVAQQLRKQNTAERKKGGLFQFRAAEVIASSAANAPPLPNSTSATPPTLPPNRHVMRSCATSTTGPGSARPATSGLPASSPRKRRRTSGRSRPRSRSGMRSRAISSAGGSASSRSIGSSTGRSSSLRFLLAAASTWRSGTRRGRCRSFQRRNTSPPGSLTFLG
jgi:N-6 DNA Methylase